jgi:hypothetical protein
LAQTTVTTIPRSFDTLRISNARITAFRSYEKGRITEENQKKREANLTRGVYNGFMSGKTKRQIKEYLHNWIGSVGAFFHNSRTFRRKADHQFCFVTLTLPAEQAHEDKELARKLIKPFLQDLKRKKDIQNYLYVTERQKNLNLHWHLIIDKPIDHGQLRALWNKHLARLGYIDQYRKNQEWHHRNGFKVRAELAHKWKEADQFAAYCKGLAENWSNPNTTDIHSLKRVYNVPAYLTKYITKSDETTPIFCRLWGCSDTLRAVTPITIPLSQKFKAIIRQFAEERGSRLYADDFAWTIWRFDIDVLYDLYPVLAEIWKNFVKHCIRTLYPIDEGERYKDMKIESRIAEQVRLCLV